MAGEAEDAGGGGVPGGEVLGGEEVGADRGAPDQADVLERPGHAGRRPLVGREVGDVDVPEPHPAGVGPAEPADDVEQRRLAGAVRADDPDDLQFADDERDVVQRLDAAEADGAAVDLKHGPRPWWRRRPACASAVRLPQPPADRAEHLPEPAGMAGQREEQQQRAEDEGGQIGGQVGEERDGVDGRGEAQLVEEVIGEGEEHRADDDPGPAPQPPDDRHDHEHQGEAELELAGHDRRGVVGQERAGHRGEDAGDHEGDQGVPLEVGSEAGRHPGVLPDGQQRPAGLRRREPPVDVEHDCQESQAQIVVAVVAGEGRRLRRRLPGGPAGQRGDVEQAVLGHRPVGQGHEGEVQAGDPQRDEAQQQCLRPLRPAS